MSVELVSDLWSELKRYISSVDREEAAETIVSLLVDHDYDIDDIRQAFKGDSNMKAALAHYIQDHQDAYEDEEDEDDDDFGYSDGYDDEDEDEDY